MIYRKLISVILLSIFYTENCSGSLSLRKLDSEFIDVIQDASNKMSVEIQRDIEFVKNPINVARIAAVQLLLDDFVFEYKDMELVLTNVKFPRRPQAKIMQANPDMMYNYLDVIAQWSDVVIEASYQLEVHQKGLLQKQKQIKGELRFGWQNVQSDGRISFRPLDTDGFESNNYDMKVSTSGSVLEVLGRNAVNPSSIIPESARLEFESSIQNKLEGTLQQLLRNSIDDLLKNKSIEQMFDYDHGMVQKYRTYFEETENMANELVDELLDDARPAIRELGYWQIPLKDIYKAFSRKYAFIKVDGYLSMSGGSAQNLSTIERKSNFSISDRGNETEISGSLGFKTLTINYEQYKAKIWNIGPSGSISADVGSNLISLKLRVSQNVDSHYGVKVLGYDLNISLDDIKVKATGLSFVLNWLLSIIATSVTKNSKEEIINSSEEYLHHIIGNLLNTLL